MTFEDAFASLKNECKCKRSDWGYPIEAVITLEEHNGDRHFYITGKYSSLPTMLTGYGITYQDIISNKWELVP